MSSIFEYEGKNVEMAIENACNELKIQEDGLNYEVLSYGSTGIFGLVGVKKARIRITLPDNKDRAVKVNVKDDSIDEREDPGSERAEPHKDDPEMDAVAQEGKTVLKGLLDFISEDNQISVDIKRNRICYSVSSENSGMLIGKRGQTLDAIQYIVEKILNKNVESRIRIQVDVEGYLESRKDNLKELAVKLSKKVKKTGKPVTVGHMSAHDRRIIHVALKNDKKVRTQSMGDGFLRKIVIFPKRRPNSSRNKVTKNSSEN